MRWYHCVRQFQMINSYVFTAFLFVFLFFFFQWNVHHFDGNIFSSWSSCNLYFIYFECSDHWMVIYIINLFAAFLTEWKWLSIRPSIVNYTYIIRCNTTIRMASMEWKFSSDIVETINGHANMVTLCKELAMYSSSFNWEMNTFWYIQIK